MENDAIASGLTMNKYTRVTSFPFFIFQVQNDHFDEFFAPELDKHGYQALFKRKTNEVGLDVSL